MQGSLTSIPLAIAAGGAIGAVMRHYLASFIMRLTGSGFPYGTLTVNIAGSFMMGLVVSLLALKFSPGGAFRAFLTVGLLGGFTTFSAFSMEAALMIERHETGAAALYIVLSVALTLAGLFAGLALGRIFS